MDIKFYSSAFVKIFIFKIYSINKLLNLIHPIIYFLKDPKIILDPSEKEEGDLEVHDSVENTGDLEVNLPSRAGGGHEVKMPGKKV